MARVEVPSAQEDWQQKMFSCPPGFGGMTSQKEKSHPDSNNHQRANLEHIHET
jgi:hypothetical protein